MASSAQTLEGTGEPGRATAVASVGQEDAVWWLGMGIALGGAPEVCFQPLGRHDEGLLQAAARGVRALYGFPVEVLESRPFPASAWTPERERWRADRLLDWLRTAAPDHCRVVVGFTREDISTTKGEHADWGVFGLGEVGGRTAMVSSYRLRSGRTKAESQLRRVVKVTNHEVGHVLGLPHGGGPGCLMNDARGRVSTVDAEWGLLCAGSQRAVERRWGVRLPVWDRFPWAQVGG